MAKTQNPFKGATQKDKRLKLMVWGDSGVGKTTLALQFPNPAVIDLEGGTDWYGTDFEFDVLPANTPDLIMDSIDYLLFEKHEYKTLIIDPITVYWESLQKKWSDILLKRNPRSKGFKHEFYDLQPKDWMTVKAELKAFIRKLTMLDMSVIVTAREKTKYDDGGYMKAIGETFDGDKSLPYMFDTVLRLYINGKGQHVGIQLKDRSNKFPKDEFECSYQVVEGFLGKENINRESKPIQQEQRNETKQAATERRFNESMQSELRAMCEKIRRGCLKRVKSADNAPTDNAAIASQAKTILSSFSTNAGYPINTMNDIKTIDHARAIIEEMEK
jgi:hypothetical protein